MRKLLLVAVLFIGTIVQMNAQEADKFRFDFDLGYAIPQGGGGGGVAFYLEPKWNIEDNMSVGLRFGGAALVKNIEYSDNNQEAEAEVGVNGSYVGTYDYYFNDGSSSFAPFVGGGLGYYSVASVAIDGNSSGTADLEGSGKFGAMIRGGFNWAGFKMTLDYNIVGKSDLQDFNGDVVGTTKNGYLGISLGFFVGGGKWGR
ncbi:hypothetical protein [Dokdonia sp. Hel_I_53]|uniref:hypothetical protein n=1 Tax=Dokdonia sp. Hel_I_53 TaxID=1566287 RepID=UPI00119AC751|nr:hypothetical protein [Dokdonia sp. Hel_I_53]TVZ51954.1 hypothetical protein OD90_1116 [Dokdonia sp. Hel_I_53]